MPRVATASSTLHSTDGVPAAGWLARISVPGAATESGASDPLKLRLHGNANRARTQSVAFGHAIDLGRLEYRLVVGEVLGERRHLEDAHRDAGIQVHDAVGRVDIERLTRLGTESPVGLAGAFVVAADEGADRIAQMPAVIGEQGGGVLGRVQYMVAHGEGRRIDRAGDVGMLRAEIQAEHQTGEQWRLVA